MITIYTDGSGHADGSAGYGLVYVHPDYDACYSMFGPLEKGTTHQQAELRAALIGLYNIPEKDDVLIVSDSQYLVSGMNEWAFDWLNRSLQWYGVTTFGNETVPELYRILRNTIGPRRPLSLETSSQELVANQDVWEALWKFLLGYSFPVTFEWVRGHQEGEFYNNKADELARWGRELSYLKYNISQPAVRNRRIT